MWGCARKTSAEKSGLASHHEPATRLPTNEKYCPSAYLPAFQNNCLCFFKKCYPPAHLPTKNVIRPPTYLHFKILSVCLPTSISKYCPSAYLPTKKCWATFQNNCLCFFKKCYPSARLPTKKMLSVHLPTKNVIRPPTCISKNVDSHHLPAFQNVNKLIAQLSCVWSKSKTTVRVCMALNAFDFV